MSSYSDWLTTNRTKLTNAVTEAYNNRNAGNNLALAWTAMTNNSDVNAMLPTGSTKFYGGSPTATETDITILQNWLTANPTEAGYLNLSPEATATNNSGQSNIGGGGNVGTEKRKWKGQPLYTFGNGILVGKNDKLVAAIGSEGGTDLDGFGTDTITYFDGVPFSKGTNIAGTTVVAGDMVVSGSLQGSGGVIIIDDVIQLERGYNNPAGIGVDSDGKILLRHRGEGFLDLVDEDERIKNEAIDTTKNWVGSQNRNAARYGSSLIPNSSFEIKETSGTQAGGNYAERPAGVITIGATASDITYPQEGVVRFNGNGRGILFPAVAIEGSKFAVRIRYAGEAATNPTAGNSTEQGLFLAMFETSDDNLDGKQYVYQTGSGANPSVTIESGISAHATNVTINLLNATGDDPDGSAVPISSGTWSQSTFTYTPTSGTNFASFAVFGKNLAANNIFLDFIVMTPVTVDLAAVQKEIDDSVGDIAAEANSSLVPDAQMTKVAKWAAWNGSSLDGTLLGDEGQGDAAIGFVTASGVAGGIISSKIDCNSDSYVIGYRLKAINNNATVRVKVIENPSETYSGMVDNTTPLDPTYTAGNYTIKNITLTALDNNNNPTGSPGNTITLTADAWTTIIGTYEAGNSGTITSSSNVDVSVTRPSEFSLWLQADTANAAISVDYVYARAQTASLNLAQTLATAAYADAESFVTDISELLTKEAGSLVSNCAMAWPSSGGGGPASYRADGTNAVITRQESSGDASVRVTADSGTRTLITPVFKMDSADKYSIGITVKGHGGSANIKLKVAYSADNLPQGKATIAPSSYSNLASDVQTGGVSVTSALEIDPGNSEGGSDATDWNVGTTYENILYTWTKPSGNWKTGSIIVESDGDFEVDYVLVKEQVVSYSLADSQAVVRRGEAVDASRLYSEGVQSNITQEAGSLLPNAAFASFEVKGNSYHRPIGYIGTRGTNSVKRIIKSASGNIATQSTETVSNVGQNGDALEFKNTSTDEEYGLLCPAVTLGISPAAVNGISPSNNGRYSFVARVRSSAEEPISIKVVAHESFVQLAGDKTHVYEDTLYDSGAGIETGYSSTVQNFTTGSSATGAITNLSIINITNTSDVTPGTSGIDAFTEIIPVDNGEADGDTDNVASNYETWYDIGGTYTANTNTKVVCFEILINNDVDSDNNLAHPYVDYIYFAPQVVDADFADSLASARKQELIDNEIDAIETDIATMQTQINNINAAVEAEDPSNSLIPSSTFFETFADSGSDYAKNWYPTRSAATRVKVYAQGNGSIGTYAKPFEGTGDTDNHYGLLSKAILTPVQAVTSYSTEDTTDSIGRYNLVVRCRGLTANSGNNKNFSVQIIAHEQFTGFNPGTTSHVIATSATPQSTPHTDTAVTLGTFTANNTNGKTTELTVIDLGNNSATASAEQSVASNHTDWRNILGTYTPDERTQAVSFEFLFDVDPDSGADDQEILIDSVFMAISSTPYDIAHTISDTRGAAAEAAAEGYTDTQRAQIENDRRALLETVASEGNSDIDNHTFTTRETLSSVYSSSPDTERPKGFAIYRSAGVGSGHSDHNTAADRKRHLYYTSAPAATGNVIILDEGGDETLTTKSILCPALVPPERPLQYKVALKCRSQATGDNVDIKIRAHQCFSSIDPTTYNTVAAGASGTNYTVNSIDYNHTASDLISTTNHEAEPRTYLFSPSHFTITTAMHTNGDVGSAPAGTVSNLDLIYLDNNTDATIASSKTAVSNEWRIICGSFEVHADTEAVSIEIEASNLAADSGLIIDSIILLPYVGDVTLAEQLQTARLLNYADTLEAEEESEEELVNVIKNPRFANYHLVNGIARPNGWRFVGEDDAPTAVGYKVGSTFVNKPIKSKKMGLASAGVRGVTHTNTNYDPIGIVSKPFKITAEDYELEMKFKYGSTSDLERVWIIMLEYTGILKPVWLKPNHNNYNGDNNPIRGVSGQTNATRRKNLLGRSLTATQVSTTYNGINASSNSAVLDDSAPTDIWYLDDVGQTQAYYYQPADTNSHVLKMKYEPADDVRWAALYICVLDSDAETLTFDYINVLADQAEGFRKTVTRKSSGFAGASALTSVFANTNLSINLSAGGAMSIDTDPLNANTAKQMSSTMVGLGNVANESPASLAANTNFTNNFGSKSVVDGHVTNFTNATTRFDNERGRQGRRGKGKMGVFDNGRMTITENTSAFSFANTTESLKPAGWETYGQATNQISYKSGTDNKVAQLGYARSGMISPAFEIKEDKYKFKLRIGTNRANMNFGTSAGTAINTEELQLIVFYTTTDDLDGEYVISSGATTTIDSGDQHTSSVSIAKLGANSSGAISTSGYTIRTFEWDPASNVTFASVMIYGYYANTYYYVDWITGFADSRAAAASKFRGVNSPFTFSQIAGTTTSGATVDIQDIGGLSTDNRLIRTVQRNNWRTGTSNVEMEVSNIYANGDDIRCMGFTVGSISRAADDGQLKIEQNANDNSNGLRILQAGTAYYWSIWMQAYSTGNTGRLYFTMGSTNRAYIRRDVTVSAMNFTGQHKVEDNNDNLSNADIGLIVVSTGRYNNLVDSVKPTINESLPIVELATRRNQKSCFGVLSNKEDRNGGPREYSVGAFVTVDETDEKLDRLVVNSLGEGAIWICNINGNLENGDYITTCEVPGYGMLQDDDLLHNYTVAKITQDCTFELDNPNYECVEFEHEGQTYRKAFVGCTYHCG